MLRTLEWCDGVFPFGLDMRHAENQFAASNCAGIVECFGASDLRRRLICRLSELQKIQTFSSQVKGSFYMSAAFIPNGMFRVSTCGPNGRPSRARPGREEKSKSLGYLVS
jgi:hypothetical protein